MLTVYRASAGAGKTHRLTGEFLTLLFINPGAFRRILAVTFTNKATEEMKKRIIDELYNLASEKQSAPTVGAVEHFIYICIKLSQLKKALFPILSTHSPIVIFLRPLQY